MSALRCPYCGVECTDATVRADSSFDCPSCGKVVESPASGGSNAATPQGSGAGSNRWSEGPPEVSASRWSAQPPLGDDSSSSESVSQSSILPEADLEQPVQVRQPVAPLVWALIVLALFLAALIGVIVVARSIRPWIDARKQGTVELRMPDREVVAGKRHAPRTLLAGRPFAFEHAAPERRHALIGGFVGRFQRQADVAF